MVAFILGLALALGVSANHGLASGVPAAPPASQASPESANASPLPTPQFRRYGIEDGLPSSSVYAIAEDHAGAIWFGTKGGIARFDGVHFQVFRHAENDPGSLYDNGISTLLVDRQGNVWAGGLNAGLNRYDAATGKFRHWGHDPADPHSLASDRVWVVTQAPDGTIWVGTGAGLERMLPDGSGFEHVVNPLLGPHPQDFGTVAALYVDPRGRLWAGCGSGVFRRETDGHFVRIKPAGPKQSMDAWRIDGSGDEVRIATEGGLSIVGSDDVARPLGEGVIPTVNVMSSTRDAAGRLWIGTQRGMYLQMRRGGPVTAVIDQPLLYGALPGSWIWQTLVDREGGLWVALLDGGVGYLAPGWNSFSRFTHIPDDPASLRDSAAVTMARGRDGRHVWVGEREGRIDRLDPVTGSVQHVLDGLHGDVIGMTEDDHRRLWVAVQGALYRYDYVHDHLDRVDPQGVMKRPLEVEPGPDGKMYARTFGQGLFRIDPETLVASSVAMDKPNDKVMWGSQMTLYKGHFWYASDGGLMWLDSAHDRFVMVPGAPVGVAIDAFDFDRSGIWMATTNGLLHYGYRGDGVVLDRTVDAAKGWPTLNVLDLDVDCYGRVWIFGNDGLWRFDPGDGSFHAIGLEDGLTDGEFSRGYALMPTGFLYAATQGGVVGFNPDKPDPQRLLPTLSVTQITVRRHGVERNLPFHAQPVEVGWRDSQLHVQARVFSYIDPWANHYRFRLDGFDNDWVDRDNHGEREFTGLGSGDYTLHIMARGAGGDWVKLAPALHIHVQAPPWLRWWAWTIYAALAVAMVALLLWTWRRRLAHRHRMQLAEQRHQIAEQASAAKSQFLATLSHEIRTPMTGVIGMAELLLSTPLSDAQREYAEAVQRASNVLLKLLNDALDLARIEAGKLMLEPVPFDPRTLVQDVVRLQKNAAHAKGLALNASIGENVPPALLGDALRIRQVLFNLVNNAVKFTEHGGVSIFVRWQDDLLHLDVSDTGPGIPLASHERLFRRFEQDEGPQRGAGSGLGLAICNELVALMEGRLELESAPGHGSLFHVRLPLAISHDIIHAKPERVSRAHERALNLLLVESDATAATVIRGMLEYQGHRVRCAVNGLNALAEIEQEHCDAILVDLDLPGIDGFQVAQLIRRGEAPGEHVPMIAITTRTRAEEVARGHQSGIDGFLRKPVTGAQLSAALAKVLAAKVQSPPETDPA